MGEKQYDTGINPEDFKLKCRKCNKDLIVGPVHLEYLGSGFPVELFKCPECGRVFVPEALALGKMHHVEQSLEDK